METVQSDFHVPGDDILRELGRVQVLHGHLDYTLRLAIKRMLGIAMDDPRYWNATDAMTSELRKRAGELIARRYHDDEDTADPLYKVLDDAAEATKLRNMALHSAWMRVPGEAPLLHDRDRKLREHVHYHLPTLEDLANLCNRIQRVHRALNHITWKLLDAAG